jgi:hypothetical protein
VQFGAIDPKNPVVGACDQIIAGIVVGLVAHACPDPLQPDDVDLSSFIATLMPPSSQSTPQPKRISLPCLRRRHGRNSRWSRNYPADTEAERIIGFSSGGFSAVTRSFMALTFCLGSCAR